VTEGRPDSDWIAPDDGLPRVTSSSKPGTSPAFHSLLSPDDSLDPWISNPGDRSFATDLNFDQIASGVAKEQEEHELITALLYGRTFDARVPPFRQEVFHDLEDPQLLAAMRSFAEGMVHVRRVLTNIEKITNIQQHNGWFLDAASTYCSSVTCLESALTSCKVTATSLLLFRTYLTAYVTGTSFQSLDADTKDQRRALDGITYALRIGSGHVEVRRYEGESDYSATIEAIFDRFRQGDVKDYRVQHRTWPGMNHIGAQIADRVAKLFPDQFSRLDEYCSLYTEFFADPIRRFERELHFFLAYIGFIEPLRANGLPFCYPEIATDSKAIFANDAFDLALAHKLAEAANSIVRNDFALSDTERVIVVSGPNQGGKTTFARMFGQLHQLASIGCPVPGTSARLVLFDHMFTHFEREEDLGNLRGKLEDDLVRVQGMLERATSQSIVILNEVFTSTTLKDSRFLGRKAMQKIVQLDLLCVYVTFVEELASFAPSVVSMVSTVVPDNPAERTFKVVRAPADGLAYAMAIAEKHGLTYSRLRERLAS
jgi:DNA mismatch repair protein MutS